MVWEHKDLRVKGQVRRPERAKRPSQRLPKMPRPPPAPGCPNPLFQRWLGEWRDQAAERGRPRSQRAYERALSSLQKYPLPLSSGREARILQHFGEHICRQLDERLERHRRTQAGLESPTFSPRELEDADPSDEAIDILALPPAPCAADPDRPQETCLKSPRTRGYLTKPELQRAAQPLSDKSFFPTDPGSKITAWSAVSTLIRKELVLKTNIPARYSLTETGQTLAQELIAVEEPLPLQDPAPGPATITAAGPRESLPLLRGDGQSLGKDASLAPSCGEPRARPFKPQFVLRPGQFDVILCVDFIETTGGPTSRKQDLVEELQQKSVPFSIRKLHIGDFLWVARERASSDADQPHLRKARELVLDYVVERKRMPDLCGSIIDGRFREQKFRLRQCGLSHPIYLVEDAGSAQHLSLPEKTLQQAVINTQVVDSFFIKHTRDLRESAAYLTIMTRHLTRLYEDKTLLGCTKEELEQERLLQLSDGCCKLLTFAEFNEGAMKNKAQTVSEVFARQLMQISGLSGDKAAAILESYKTPASLLAAYAACQTPQNCEQLLSNVKCGKLQRNFGPALSKTLAQLYCTPGPLP
ncbi:crossover junction endonuclease MUS81 isoform X2 [Hemicordylus capensis]|uniref:crossover junction endonuclease MUS81 isoform X2 n=1 Tax=Hemicordylus capensis TaxID=884348 RepID=UPI002303AE65|nr:crossover junction endonuclease MUS81 isoform X2 [Hemicordylus capensis]